MTLMAKCNNGDVYLNIVPENVVGRAVHAVWRRRRRHRGAGAVTRRFGAVLQI